MTISGIGCIKLSSDTAGLTATLGIFGLLPRATRARSSCAELQRGRDLPQASRDTLVVFCVSSPANRQSLNLVLEFSRESTTKRFQTNFFVLGYFVWSLPSVGQNMFQEGYILHACQLLFFSVMAIKDLKFFFSFSVVFTFDLGYFIKTTICRSRQQLCHQHQLKLRMGQNPHQRREGVAKRNTLFVLISFSKKKKICSITVSLSCFH